MSTTVQGARWRRRVSFEEIRMRHTIPPVKALRTAITFRTLRRAAR
ncbi:hypothetical protein WME91_11275 [Sorangium sp. So ce269]